MNINPVLNLLGQEVFTAGGSDSYSVHEYAGYWVSLEWFVGLRTTEPMMVIRDAKHASSAGMVGICLSSIGAYADADTRSNAAPGAITRCSEHLPTLGRESTFMESMKLLDVILHFASQLIAMPPTPRAVRLAAKGESIIDVHVTHEESGKTHSEVSL